MNSEKAELISALADDNLYGREREAALAALRDERLRERWQRYHLIGDVIRGEAAPQIAMDLAARVREQLESEPLHLPVRRRLSPHLGWAMAASAALAAVLLVATRPLNESATPTTLAQANRPTNFVVVRDNGPGQGEWERLDERELAPYLVNHHAHSNALAVPASVRIVSHEVMR
ncbi:sigma-E factor negative regulatory protein [Endothiovibrio diazotrophicus]